MFGQFDGFLDDIAQLTEDHLGVRPVTTAKEQFGAATDEAPVLLRPLNELDVSVALFHRLDPSIANLTAHP